MRTLKNVLVGIAGSVLLLLALPIGQPMACCCPDVSVVALEGMKNRPIIEGDYYQKYFGVRDMSALEKGEISIQVGDSGGSLLRLVITLPNRYKGKNIRVVFNAVHKFVEPAKGLPFLPMSRFTVSLYLIEERGGIQTVKVLDKNKVGGVKAIALGPKNFILTDHAPARDGESYRVSVVVRERGVEKKIVAAHTVSGEVKNLCGLKTYVMSKKRASVLKKRISQDSSGGVGVLVYQNNAVYRFRE